MKYLPVAQLIQQVDSKLCEQKFCPDTLRHYRSVWKKLIVFAKKYRMYRLSWEYIHCFCNECFGIELTNEFLDSPSSRNLIFGKIRPLFYLLIYQGGGSLVRIRNMKMIKSPEKFFNARERFVENCHECGNKQSTIDGKLWVINPFMLYLQQSGMEYIAELSKKHVTEYTTFLTARAVKTIHEKLRIIKHFLKFLYNEHFINTDLSVYVPKTAGRTKRLANSLTPEEIGRLLGAIERGTAVGKRDYAVFLLVSHTGLRTCDITNLQFENISWSECKIHLIQEKTQKPLELPLSEEVGRAIIDYLKHGRPCGDASRYVFVRHSPPYGKIENFWYPMQKYLRFAGISTAREKPHGLHTFRFSLATRLLDEEVALETIAAVLGHTSSNATQNYFRVGINRLRECALNPEEVFEDGA